jgi:hypothetical protein
MCGRICKGINLIAVARASVRGVLKPFAEGTDARTDCNTVFVLILN